jgi:uncharacterized alpha-E superfamily protein
VLLSRVAESLYWMARYIERAEDLTRLLAVNFNALLETQPENARQGWEPLVKMTGDEELFYALYPQASSQNITEFLLWHPQNVNAVTSCVTRARENARTVREQISSEMWGQLNRLYFLLHDVNRTAVLNNPSDFFGQVRDGSQAFQGITTATMSHGEPYQFVQLGLYLERADKIARILNAKYLYISRLKDDSAETALQLIALLRSCSAFEPYRRTAKGVLNSQRVAEFLLLDPEFPRAVGFCFNQSMQALTKIENEGGEQARAGQPSRSLGRLKAELEYMDIQEILGDNMDPYLGKLLLRINKVGDDIEQAYFSTRVILPDRRPQQQQQQQAACFGSLER